MQWKCTDQTIKHVYESLPSGEDVPQPIPTLPRAPPRLQVSSRLAAALLTIPFLVIAGTMALTTSSRSSQTSACDSVWNGYQCQSEISHSWGQYSPYFSVPSEISAGLPSGCKVTFAQILSRHGARDPTASHTVLYNKTIRQIQENVHSFVDDYAFLQDYIYTLGADQLTTFGEQELVNSGIKFYERYKHLAAQHTLFFRSSGQTRVVESAQNFSQGYHQARSADPNATAPDTFPYAILVIPEADGSNNTLHHGLCTDFAKGTASKTGDEAQAQWRAIFTPPIMARLSQNLAGANLSPMQTIYLMDLCPFDTVASPTGTISPFCALFSIEEWHQYDYYQSLGKYYGFGNGNALGPTQGVGFTNELIARMTGTPVIDHTSVNHTLDGSNTTFPLGDQHVLFADFSHDNDITTIFSALGLYNATPPLSNTSLPETPGQTTAGYSASWTVPFAARAYFEKMTCNGGGGMEKEEEEEEEEEEELVRVIVNDRVVPLQNCDADRLGRCTLRRFVESLSFARGGGSWDRCFT